MDFPFKPNFIEINGIKIHFVSEGKMDVPTILFLHGVPTWSYTFRKLFPICLNEGFRIIAPDLPGFGKSEKAGDKTVFSLHELVNCVETFIRKLDLQHIFLFAHDWGAIIGMILAAKSPEYFSGIITSNGLLPIIGKKTPPQFDIWKLFSRCSPFLPVGRIVSFGCQRKLSKSERSAYNFPFSNKREKLAIRVLPQLVPLKLKDPGAELINKSWKQLEMWEKPFLTVFSTNDPISKGGEKIIQSRIPGTQNQAHKLLIGKHFLQEDQAESLGKIITDFVKNN